MKICLLLWHRGIGVVNMCGDRSGKGDIWTGEERSETRTWRKIHNKEHVDSYRVEREGQNTTVGGKVKLRRFYGCVVVTRLVS
jgi:hypothetical protein